MLKRQVIEIPGVSHRSPIPMAAKIGNLLYSSAVMGMDPETGVVPADPALQAELVFKNVRTILSEAGGTTDNVVDFQVLVTDRQYRQYVNTEWLKMFPDPANRPARVVIESSTWPRPIMVKIAAVLETD